MYGHNLVAIYPSHLEAEAVKEKLLSAGVTSNSVRISDAPNTVIRSAPTTQREEPGFFAWLFGDVSEDDRTCYDTHMQQNRAILSVHVEDQDRYRRALDIMEEARPIRLDDDTDASSSTEAISSRAVATQHQGNPAFADPPPVAGRSAQSGTQQRGQEQVIPVVKEELAVGKQATEQHTRVRVYTVSRPVEQQVTLRDERVIVEHRPATGAATTGMPQERTIDVIERHETAVAEKRGRVAEEVVVRKEVTERPETVRGTVQETKVEVEKEPAVGPRPRNP
jgi:hypothetical protein